MNPLSKSPRSVKPAAILWPLLITFVAPGLFEPYVLGSESPNKQEMIIENGIEPIKYSVMYSRKLYSVGIIIIDFVVL